MKNLNLILFIICLITSFTSCKKLNPTTPDLLIFLENNPQMRVPDGYKTILDQEELLSEAEEKIIEEEFFKAGNDHDFVGQFMSLSSIEPYTDPAVFTMDIGNYYGLGHKQHNDGLIVLLSDSLKFVQIATGIGTEEFITNEECEFIIDNVMLPQFKKQNYGEGVLFGVQALRVAKVEKRFQTSQ